MRDLGYRLTGSSDLYADDGRRPYASHQLRHRARRVHPARPGLLRRASTTRPTARATGTAPTTTGPGTAGSRARPTTRRVTRAARRQVRNLLTTLLLSTGVPMLVAGDEIGRTQGGNNNAYCQDNEISWLDWSTAGRAGGGRPAGADPAADRAAAGLPVLRQRAFFAGRPVPGGGGRKDLAWFTPDGSEMTERDWYAPDLRTLGMYLDGDGHPAPRPARRADHRRVLPAGAARRRRGHHVRAARAAVGERLGGGRRHHVPGRAAAGRRVPARGRARPAGDRALGRPAARRPHPGGRRWRCPGRPGDAHPGPAARLSNRLRRRPSGRQARGSAR